jgi:hypothetical protein
MRVKFLLAVLFLSSMTYAQNKENWFKENMDFSGYVKYLNTSSFENFDSFLIDNLLHNRLNLKLYLNKNLTTSIEIRNRVFWGNSVQNIPDYASFIDNDSHNLDLSVNIINQPGLLFHSKIDRLYIDYHSDKWQITLGRQRINWGKNLVWNPNDLFNTYSYIDFDYEERPGADALRIQYFLSGDSSIESVINYTENWEDNTVAVKYNFHKYNYDFQILIAKYRKDYTIGVGWEGAIKTLGIKGEFSYFTPQGKSNLNEDVLLGSVSLDYYFRNGISVNSAVLYNSGGIKNTDFFEPSQFNSLDLSAKNLMPNQWSYFFQVSKALTPAINASLSSIYAYELEGIFIMPQFGYAISQNWDLDIISQIYYGKQDEKFSNIQNSLFLRFRWSF